MMNNAEKPAEKQTTMGLRKIIKNSRGYPCNFDFSIKGAGNISIINRAGYSRSTLHFTFEVICSTKCKGMMFLMNVDSFVNDSRRRSATADKGVGELFNWKTGAKFDYHVDVARRGLPYGESTTLIIIVFACRGKINRILPNLYGTLSPGSISSRLLFASALSKASWKFSSEGTVREGSGKDRW